MDWKTIEEQITQNDQNKWDQKVSGEKLRVSQTGRLEVLNGDESSESFSLSDLATTQMCQRLEIPVAYYRRLPGDMKALVANFDLDRHRAQEVLLRGKGEWLRAFLSGKYVVYDNSRIAETAHALLEKGDVMVKTFVLEETHFYLKIVSEEIVDTASGLKAGVMIGNSEVGMGSVSVEPFIFRKPCTNDLIISQEKAFRHAHIHFLPSELNRRMAEGIAHAFETASAVLDVFLSSRMEPVPDPVETIKRLAIERKLSQKLTDEVVSHFQAEPEFSRFGVINAFTAAAQILPSLQRIEVERYAGTLLTTSL